MPTKILSISVMAHPSREKFFPYLKERLGDVPFSIDHASEGVYPNFRKAWLLHDPKAKYHTVIQDDAIVCDNFRERAEAFLGQYGALNRAASFYFGNREDLGRIAIDALETGVAIRNRPGWGVALCLPTALIGQMLKECDVMGEPQDDARFGRFCVNNKIKIYYPMPCYIDHRVADEVESLVGDKGRNRHAKFFIDTYKPKK